MRTASWETISRFIAAGDPFAQPMGGSRGVQIVFDAVGRKLSLRLPLVGDEARPRVALASISLGVAEVAGIRYLNVQLEDQTQAQAFHQLAALAAAEFETPGVRAGEALERALERWSALLRRQPLLSPEEQVGLRGEIALLRVLIARFGAAAVGMWTAYDRTVPGRHDFRLPGHEIEVKSTRRRERIHRISGLNQLRPSPGLALHVLSLQFEQAGASGGLSLADAVRRTRDSLVDEAAALRVFEQHLSEAGYQDRDDEHYEERLILADEPRLIRVDVSIPAFTEDRLASVMPEAALARLVSLTYEVNLRGLGAGPGSSAFASVLGQQQFE